MDNIHNRIILLRKNLNISQKEFSEKIGVAQTTFSSIELGECKIRPVYLIAICSIFNVNEKWLLTGQGEIFNTKKQFADEFFDLYNTLDPKCQKLLLNFSKDLLKFQEDIFTQNS